MVELKSACVFEWYMLKSCARSAMSIRSCGGARWWARKAVDGCQLSALRKLWCILSSFERWLEVAW